MPTKIVKINEKMKKMKEMKKYFLHYFHCCHFIPFIISLLIDGAFVRKQRGFFVSFFQSKVS
jgi:hypothetical protein